MICFSPLFTPIRIVCKILSHPPSLLLQPCERCTKMVCDTFSAKFTLYIGAFVRKAIKGRFSTNSSSISFSLGIFASIFVFGRERKSKNIFATFAFCWSSPSASSLNLAIISPLGRLSSAFVKQKRVFSGDSHFKSVTRKVSS